MSEPFIAEVRIFAGNFAPRGWAFCDGQLLPIANNTALFSLIGTTYGGDGRATTGLPDLQGRSAMHPGSGPGLTRRRLGQITGTEIVTLSEDQIPSHTHTLNGASASAADTGLPSAVTSFSRTRLGRTYSSDVASLVPLSSAAVANAGGSQAHSNLQPYLAVTFIIALVGLYPSRS